MKWAPNSSLSRNIRQLYMARVVSLKQAFESIGEVISVNMFNG